MSAGVNRGPQAELLALTQAYCNGTLTDDEWARLERRLLDDADARALFRRYMALDAALRDYGASAAEHWLEADRKSGAPGVGTADTALRSTPSRTHRWWIIRLAMRGRVVAAIAAVVVLGVLLLGRMQAEANVIASLEQVTGDVRILAADGQVRTIAADAPVRAGDTLRTRGSESSTIVAYPDGTRLTLIGDTSITCGKQHSKSLVVHQGTLAASVRPQPRETPLTLATPTAQVEVLGTRLLIEAAANRTDLHVTRGRVRLVRVSDASAVEVSDGEYAVVTERNELLVKEIPSLSTTWEADFENGLPEGWEYGEHVTQGLPPGSRGAVRAARDVGDDGVTYYGIGSQSAWSQGLFAVRRDSHLHMTFKMENPSWLNVFLVTRTSEPHELRFSGNFIFKDFPKIAPGRWLTISIPLSKFRKLHSGPEPLEQLTPFHLIFNSTAPDRGLIIDRMWITPDGPGEVTIRDIE